MRAVQKLNIYELLCIHKHANRRIFGWLVKWSLSKPKSQQTEINLRKQSSCEHYNNLASESRIRAYVNQQSHHLRIESNGLRFMVRCQTDQVEMTILSLFLGYTKHRYNEMQTTLYPNHRFEKGERPFDELIQFTTSKLVMHMEDNYSRTLT